MKPTIIFFTDCKDSNALARVFAHITARIKNSQVQCYGIESWQEAALNIANTVEVWIKAGSKGNVVVGNIAPRTDKNWENGAPFCFAWVQGNLIVATPYCFAVLVKQRLLNATEIFQTDVKDVCIKFLSIKETKDISTTQFRSLWYVPRLIQWLLKYKTVPCKVLNSQYLPSLESLSIFYIDNFGNLKLTLSSGEFSLQKNGSEKIRIGGREYAAPAFYNRLSDIPVGEIGFVVGSGADWVELILNGGTASLHFQAKIGEEITFV